MHVLEFPFPLLFVQHPSIQHPTSQRPTSAATATGTATATTAIVRPYNIQQTQHNI